MATKSVFRLTIFCILFRYHVAWNIDKVINITNSVASIRDVSCIGILNTQGVPNQVERDVVLVTKALQRQQKFTRISTLRDYKSSSSWTGCSLILSVVLGYLPNSKNLFSQITSIAADSSSYFLFLLFLPNDSNVQDYLDETFLPLQWHILTVSYNEIIQVWRIHWNSPLRFEQFATWEYSIGLTCHRPRCDFHLIQDLEGYVLRGSTREDMPISDLVGSTAEGYKIGGYFGDVFYAIAESLNCTTLVLPPTEHATGSEVNGKWNGLVGMVIRNEIDLAVGPMSMQSKVLTVSGFTPPLLRTSFQIFFKQAGTVVEWDAFVKPFAKYVWFLIIIWLIVATYTLSNVYRINVRYGHEDEVYIHEFSTLNSFLSFLRAVCQQGTNLSPFSLSCRALFLTGYLTSYILLTAYSGSLISKLAVQAPLRPFDSLATFLQDGSYKLTAIARSTDYTYFSEATNTELQEIYNKTMKDPEEKLPTSKEQGMAAVCNGHKIALFITFTVTQITASNFRIKQNCPVLYFSSPIGHVSLALAMRKNLSPSRMIQLKVQVMTERGILRRLYNKEWPLEIEKSDGVPLPPAVELKQVAPIHCILLLGILMAAFMLTLEIHSISPNMASSLQNLHYRTGWNSEMLIHVSLVTTAIGIAVVTLIDLLG